MQAIAGEDKKDKDVSGKSVFRLTVFANNERINIWKITINIKKKHI